MRRTRWLNGMLMWLCLTLCCALLAPGAQAAQTTLSVNFQGMRADAAGDWQMEPLSGEFEVLAGTEVLGVVAANDSGEAGVLSLPQTEQISLRPVMDTMPEGYLIAGAPISVSVTAGKRNDPPVLVYADAGLFTVQGEIGAAFALLDEAGEEALRFTLDDTGSYVQPTALRSGRYTLHAITNAPGRVTPDQVFELTAYKGRETDVLHLAVESFPEATAAPTPSPTPDATVPAQAQGVLLGTVRCAGQGLAGVSVSLDNGLNAITDAQGVFRFEGLTPGAYTVVFSAPDTMYAIVEPSQMVQVTAGENELSVTAEALASLRLLGAAAQGYTLILTRNDKVVLEAQAEPQAELYLPGLLPGDYTLTLALPEGTLLTGLNGHAAAQAGTAQWNISLTAGTESAYELTFAQSGSLSGTVTGLPDGTVVTAVCGEMQYQAAVAQGAYQLKDLPAGVYQITVVLPGMGAVSGEGWNALNAGELYQAVTEVSVSAGLETRLPALSRLVNAGISGLCFQDLNADGIRQEGEPGTPGAAVTLLDAAGQPYASTLTDEQGRWGFADIPAGDWQVQLTAPQGLTLLGQAGEGLPVTLMGEDLSGVDAAAVTPGQLSVHVFIDANSNGERGTYERRLAGVLVEVLPETGDAVLASASTNEEGAAEFTTLAPGVYRLRVTLPDGYGFGKRGKEIRATSSIMDMSSELTQISQPLSLPAGEPLKVGVGVNTMAEVTGTVWLDENADGIWNQEESGQAGVTVTLTGEKNGLTYTAQSGADGSYRVTQVRPGRYKLSFTCPDGLMFTKYSATGGERRSIITTEGRATAGKSIVLEAGEVLDRQHVGMARAGAIEGRAFLDGNYNGLLDPGEAPLAGVELELYKKNGDKIASAVSAEDGSFRFSALRANAYRLRVILPEGGYTFTATVDPDVTGNWLKARPGRRENSVEDFQIAAGETRQVVVGAILPASIEGVCYYDDNFTASRDKGEKTVSGLTVTLTDEAGNVLATDKTGKNGSFRFEDLTPGTYRLTMQAASGYAFTRLGGQNVMRNLTGGAGETELFALGLGEARTSMDAGMILPGTVRGAVFADLNDNGFQDAGETGLSGTRVQLVSEEGVAFEAVLDETGAFLFDAVMPGRYHVRYELPEDTVFSSVQQGGNALAGEGGTGATDWFDFAIGQQMELPLAGGVTLGSIRGVVFEDSDGDGAQSAEEHPLAGASLTLTPSRSDLEELTLTTESAGAFAFLGLHPDTYTLQLALPDGKVLTRRTGFTLPLTPGQSSQQISLPLSMGQRYDGQLLGAVTPASLQGQYWMDENNNGRMEDGEQTPAGARINVVDLTTGELFATLTTDEQGIFTASGMAPGNYTLRFALTDTVRAAQPGDSTFREEDGLLAQTVTVQQGEQRQGLRLGVAVYTSLGGRVWLDRGGSVEPVAGAHLLLTDDSGAQVQVTESGADGVYRFDHLLPGTYYIAATLPEGQLVVEPGDARLSEGGLRSLMVQVNGQSGQSDALQVRMAEDRLDLDVGSVLPGTLGDQAWLDLDGDGRHDTEEPGLPGVTVRLLRDGRIAAETVTDAYGYWRLENIYPSEYTLEAVYPPEVKPTQPGEGLLTSRLPETEDSSAQVQVTVVSDRIDRTVDLGFVLREAGVLPEALNDVPAQNWTRTEYGE